MKQATGTIGAITVRQPWAWAIAHGGKRIENRKNWAPSTATQLLIHAGSLYDRHAARVFALAGVDLPTDPPTGVFVAVVDLVGVCYASRHAAAQIVCQCGVWAEPMAVHWQLGNVRVLPSPIPVPRGRQGLWYPADDIVEAIR